MKIMFILIISKLLSLLIKIKNLNKFIKSINIQIITESESLNHIKLTQYNLKYINTANIILLIKHLSWKHS